MAYSPSVAPEHHFSLQQYNISEKYGFVPDEPTPDHFHDTVYFKPWDDLAKELPKLLSEKMLRCRIRDMPTLEPRKLLNGGELRRAYVILGFLLHGYIWESLPASQMVPTSIIVPLFEVSKRLRIAPVATYATLCLWNWKPVDPKKSITDAANLMNLLSFTGSEGERWFYMTSVAIEAQGGHLIQDLHHNLQNGLTRDNVLSTLKAMNTVLGSMGRHMSRLNDHLDPNHFYNDIRPWLMGVELLQDREDGEGQKMVSYSGGSNGQTSLFPLLDISLGISHHGENKVVIENMFQYMPGLHVDFLFKMKSYPGLGTAFHCHQDVQALYEETVNTVKELRNQHIALVTRYITIPAHKGSMQDGLRNTQPKGSAGASPLVFLKGMRDDTRLDTTATL